MEFNSGFKGLINFYTVSLKIYIKFANYFVNWNFQEILTKYLVVLEGVIPLETFPVVEWHKGELADVPSFTVLKTQICVTRPECVKFVLEVLITADNWIPALASHGQTLCCVLIISAHLSLSFLSEKGASLWDGIYFFVSHRMWYCCDRTRVPISCL